MNLERFNLLNDEQSFEALKPCVHIPSWIESIVLQRPFGSAEELYQAAALQARIWQWSEILEALAQHPRIGEKKAEQIIEYRKTNTIKNPEDLKNIKGFGDSIVGNVKNTNSTAKEDLTKKVTTVKEDKKKELNNAVDKKIEKTTGSLVPKL